MLPKNSNAALLGSGMGLDLIPANLRKRYLFEERHHATSILAVDFAEEWFGIGRKQNTNAAAPQNATNAEKADPSPASKIRPGSG